MARWNPMICHEMPTSLELAGHGKRYNDYDYVLLHLLEDDEYLSWAKSLDRTRPVYLDNSCYELGESLSNERLADAHNMLNPTLTFLPDVMGNSTATRQRSAQFFADNPGLDPKRFIGVAHGENIDAIISTYYAFEDMGVGMIAFPFCYPWMKGSCSYAHAMERVGVLQFLAQKGVINEQMPHHLLGTHWPGEFMHYHDYHWVTSIDTSNPIMAAYEESPGYPMLAKPSANLASVWDNLTTPSTTSMDRNVRVFRALCGAPIRKEMK